jgi:multicomponent Na+:H+ antiporter subunit E
MIRIALTFLLWMAIWLLWSGLYKPLLITLGVLSCLLTLYLAYRMDFFERKVYSLHFVTRLVPFWCWLGLELIKANIEVAKIVLHPRLPISPTLVRLSASTSNPVLQAILGNSITLTPGTVTLDDHNGDLLVHCLTQQGAQTIEAGEIDRRVAALAKA